MVELAGLSSEVTVTPARGEQERTFDVPEAVGIVTHEELESRPVQLLPQALREETGVLVQQTTTAQASVFIRGFSAQRVVYLRRRRALQHLDLPGRGDAVPRLD